MGASGGEEKEISEIRYQRSGTGWEKGRGLGSESRRAKFEKRRGRQDAVIVPRSLHSATAEGAVAAVGMTG